MAVWQRKRVMEKKIIETPEGRFMWKEIDENGSATGVRSEGDFATEKEALVDAGLEVAEEVEEEAPAPEVVDEPVSEEEVLDETEEKKTAEEESVESSEESVEESAE